jgi:hypothetical protein
MEVVTKLLPFFGPEFIVNIMITFLKSENQDTRLEILSFLKLNRTALTKCDKKKLIPGILNNLMDKNSDIRGLVEELVSILVCEFGEKDVFNYAKVKNKTFVEHYKSIVLNQSMME